MKIKNLNDFLKVSQYNMLNTNEIIGGNVQRDPRRKKKKKGGVKQKETLIEIE